MNNAAEYLEYERLGDFYMKNNYKKAYLCYENAEFLCPELQEKNRIKVKKQSIAEENGELPSKVSIVIVSYNCCYMMQRCIESIRKTCAPQSYEIVVVENASTDGVRDWLIQQEDIKVILCDENAGFPLGCNIGIQYSEPAADIFLLNNDTRLASNALFWLRMGLCESEAAGAVGCVANYCGNEQQIDVEFLLPEDYLRYGAAQNIPCEHPYEERNRLSGFAMLIRRKALEQIGGQLDVNLSPGYFEDDDLSMRLIDAGYRLYICHNSFIYHAGSQSFCGRDDLDEIMVRNYYYFLNKWNYDVLAYSFSNAEAIRQITQKEADCFRVLEIGAGSGVTLSRIRYFYPEAECYGLERNKQAVHYGVRGIPLYWGEWMEMELPFEKESFDYIIYTPHENDPADRAQIEERFSGYLKPGSGIFL